MKTGHLAAFAASMIITVAPTMASETAITVYNQNFGVVRETIPLSVKRGVNEIAFSDISAHVETDSVILRDRSGKHKLQILEQNYRADPISQALLLSLYEGKTIDFETRDRNGDLKIIKGKIIRSGYVPHQSAYNRYGQQYMQRQNLYAYAGANQPIIEVDGVLKFQLPGQPVFEALTDDSILKPTMEWKLEANRSGKFEAELAYVTGGMGWEAAYNVVAPEEGDILDLVGWVTIDNQSGKAYENAKIKLMAGDVSKVQRQVMGGGRYAMKAMCMDSAEMASPVSEKTFDEYHLYTLNRRTTLRDRETKQVEFIRGEGVASERIYVYDGAWIDQGRYRGWNMENIRNQTDYGTQSNPKVWVMREFENADDNNLGLPLPKGRVRFYRQDADGQLEFTGENMIDHTPKDETVRIYTGNAFDVVGERKRTDHKIDHSQEWLDETFEIKIRNHKDEPVEIRVVEHLYRWINWDIVRASDTFEKVDSQQVEFRVALAPGEEKTITYKAHYTW